MPVQEFLPVDFTNLQRLGKLHRGKTVIVKFYRPDCIHCTNTIDEYNKLAAMVGDSDFLVAQLNGSEYPDLIQTNLNYGFTIKGFPTFVIFVDSLYHSTYEGPRTAEGWLSAMHAANAHD